MTGIAERNDSAQHYVNTRLGIVKGKKHRNFPEFSSSTDVYKLLSNLIEINVKGFRGIVVTALTGLYLNKKYDPVNDFYGCSPRSIFENGVWYALQENGIPCGKSDPLNVAKNATQLDKVWAKGKRPQAAAMAVVKFLKIVMESGQTKRERLIDYFFFRLWKYAESVNNFDVVEIKTSSISRQVLGNKLVNFTLKYPESGNLPQYLVSQLLLSIYRHSKIQVKGGDESVFGTNTTSKKPADIWLKIGDIETNLYEITVKPVSKKRLDDSIEALRSTGHINHSVTYICRLPRDVSELDVDFGSYAYKGKIFDFIDYHSFCCSLFAILNNEEFSIVLKNVTSFVQDNNISMKTKAGWNEFFLPKI